LHPWQKDHLCPILDRLRHEKGLRILLHGPPQYGKSIIVSQRLPAYLIGHDPLHRVGLACYNESHSENFGAVIRDICSSAEYARDFPESSISANAAMGEFSTGPRAALRDAQPSFKALGLLSGFVGRGVDTLIVDDPYKSAADAFSEAVNTAVWRWWTQTAKPRVKPETNVVVMFHRYHLDDLAGKLQREGGWEYYRFPALADANEDGSDPTGRAIGEPLSPMRTAEQLEQLRLADPFTFAGQFQGVPVPDSGGMFQTTRINLDIPPAKFVRRVRAWDIAATPRGGDYSAGVLMGLDASGRYWILDVILLQGSPDEVDAQIDAAAQRDGREVTVRLAQDPGSAGKRDAQTIGRRLSGYPVVVVAVTGSKESRARPFASQVNLSNVSAVRCERRVTSGPYAGQTTLDAALTMLANFPLSGSKKDAVDAAADAFDALSNKRKGGIV
jgi:phage terminase large subunit-like protein